MINILMGIHMYTETEYEMSFLLPQMVSSLAGEFSQPMKDLTYRLTLNDCMHKFWCLALVRPVLACVTYLEDYVQWATQGQTTLIPKRLVLMLKNSVIFFGSYVGVHA
ncbi:MAG: hypothetical protein ACOH2R_22905 [Pseudomonas sp.]